MNRERNLPSLLLACAFVAGLATTAVAQSIELPEPVGMDGDPAARDVLRGNAAFLHGDLPGAAASYRKALQRKHDFAIATFNLGLVEMHTGNQTAGRSDMDRGIEIATQHGMSARDIGRLRELRAAFSTQAKPA